MRFYLFRETDRFPLKLRTSILSIPAQYVLSADLVHLYRGDPRSHSAPGPRVRASLAARRHLPFNSGREPKNENHLYLRCSCPNPDECDLPPRTGPGRIIDWRIETPRDYLRVKLDDPSLPEPFNAAVFWSEDGNEA